MVQVVTVSAATAAYAAEALRPSARVSGVSHSDKTVQALAAEARKSGDYEQIALTNVVQPPALALFFLTAEQQPDQTLKHAQQEYRALEDGGIHGEKPAEDADLPPEQQGD